MSPTFQALSHPQYRRYLIAQLSTGIGFWMLRLAQDWIVLDLTGGSGIAVGIATALQFIPFLIITPWAGVLADRFSRRTLMIAAHVGLTVSALALRAVAGEQIRAVVGQGHHDLAPVGGVGGALHQAALGAQPAGQAHDGDL